jgi:DNA-directed RNA polymerase specialized sigma24 family protein
VQETFVRALPKLDSLPPERADVGAYLFATEKNLFLKQVERGKRAQPVEEVPEPEEPAAIEDDPQRSLLLRRQQEEVRVANGNLAPRQRLVLALFGGAGPDVLLGGKAADKLNGGLQVDVCKAGTPGFAHGDSKVSCEG